MPYLYNIQEGGGWGVSLSYKEIRAMMRCFCFFSPNPDRVLPRRKPSIAPVAEKVGDEVHIELTPIDLSRPSHSQHTLHSLIMESPSPTDDVVDPLWHSHSSG